MQMDEQPQIDESDIDLTDVSSISTGTSAGSVESTESTQNKFNNVETEFQRLITLSDHSLSILANVSHKINGVKVEFEAKKHALNDLVIEWSNIHNPDECSWSSFLLDMLDKCKDAKN